MQERALQDEVRSFLAQAPQVGAALPRALDDRMTVLREWQASCYAAGFVGRAWPSEFGGGGRPPVEQIVVDQELAAAGAPEFVNVVGLDVLGPSLLRFGNDEQRRRYIPSILSAEEIWCQGFSEPEAGSDLASLRTRATEEDDHFVLNGSKTWVSWGQYARWCGVLARTETDGPKHKGISMLIVDMQSAGRRRAPDDADHRPRRVLRALPGRRDRPQGEPAGQRAATAGRSPCTRSATSAGRPRCPRQVKLRTWLDRAVQDAAAQGRLDDPLVQVQLAQALIGVEVLRHHAYRTVGEFLNGGAVGPDSSSVKLLMAEAEQRLAASAFEILGPEDEFWTETYLYSRAASVYGGTQQIQRNIIADRILALPQE